MGINYPNILGDVKLQQGSFRYSLVKIEDLTNDNYDDWDGQRPLNIQHVNELIMSFEKSIKETKAIKYCSSVPHIGITPQGKKYIIDGQHRINAFKTICTKYKNAFDTLVLYEQCDNEKELQEAWDRSNTVWSQIDPVGGDRPKVPRNKAVEKLWNERLIQYDGTKGMISRSEKPNKPHLNENIFLSKLTTVNFSSYEELETMFNNANKSIKKSSLCLKFKEKSPDKWIKCEKYDCFIGLVKDFTNYMTLEIDPNAVDYNEKRKKEPIPKAVKDAVWKKYNGDNGIAKCFVCEDTEIRMNAFHAGHIISDKDGGLPVVDNLIPICATCNTSMGSINLYTFKEKYFKKL